MKLHPFSLLLLIYFALNSSVAGIGFSFLKKDFDLSVFSVFSFEESIDFRTRKNTVEKQPERSQSGFWWEKPCISHVVTKYTIKWESDGRKVSIGQGKSGYQFPRLSQFDGFYCIFPCYGKSMSTSFPGSPHTMGFVGYFRETISQTFSIWWIWLSFPISLVMKYTIKSESNGRKVSIIWEKYEHQFPRFSPTMSFVAFSCTMGNWWGSPCISHMMEYTVGWESYGEKSPILWEKYEYQFPRFTSSEGFCCIFPYYEKLMGKPMHFPYSEVYHRMGMGWEKSTHTMGKVWLSISQTFHLPWVLLHFPVLWKIYGETYALPIWWYRLIFSCVLQHA